MQTPIDDSYIFTEVSRSAKLPPSPRWSPSQEIPRKGQAPGRVTLWIALGLPHAQVGLRRVFQQASPDAPHRLHYQASSRNVAGLVPSGTQWRLHHKCGWCDLIRLQAPLMYNNGAHKHLVIRGVESFSLVLVN